MLASSDHVVLTVVKITIVFDSFVSDRYFHALWISSLLIEFDMLPLGLPMSRTTVQLSETRHLFSADLEVPVLPDFSHFFTRSRDRSKCMELGDSPWPTEGSLESLLKMQEGSSAIFLGTESHFLSFLSFSVMFRGMRSDPSLRSQTESKLREILMYGGWGPFLFI